MYLTLHSKIGIRSSFYKPGLPPVDLFQSFSPGSTATQKFLVPTYNRSLYRNYSSRKKDSNLTEENTDKRALKLPYKESRNPTEINAKTEIQILQEDFSKLNYLKSKFEEEIRNQISVKLILVTFV